MVALDLPLVPVALLARVGAIDRGTTVVLVAITLIALVPVSESSPHLGSELPNISSPFRSTAALTGVVG